MDFNCKANCMTWREEFDYRGNINLANWALDEYEGEAQLNVTAGDGKGSSLMVLNMEHPEIEKNWTDNAVTVRKETCGITTLENWFARNPTMDVANYDTLVIDTQGNEMEVLNGMGKLLQNFKYLCIELSMIPVYEGETLGPVVEDWLAQRGFIADSPQLDHNDWFFVRKDIKAESSREYLGKC